MASTARIVMAIAALAGRLAAAGPGPEATAAIDQYVKLTEEEMSRRAPPNHFLWLDEHRNIRTLVWMNQSQVTAHQTQNPGGGLAMPGIVVQDWIGDVFLPNATLEHTRDVLLDYASYKVFFKTEFADSRLVKHEGDRFDFFLRLAKRLFTAGKLDMYGSTAYASVDTTHMTLSCRSTRIGDGDSATLWKLNWYWRLEAKDNGVYAELEVVAFSGESSGGRLHVLKRLEQDFAKEFAQTSVDRLHELISPARR